MFIVASLTVMVIYCFIWFEQKCQLRDTFRGGYFETSTVYLNDNAQMLYDYLLTCEIYTVRTLAPFHKKS